MKKIKRIFPILLLMTIGLFSCQNFDIEHPDFDYTAGFFPYQFPVRTLVLGDYIYDNSNDNAGKFVISVAIGGVYENKQNRVFDIQVDENLVNNLYFSPGQPVLAMPSNYYTLSSTDEIVIPKGKYNGGVEVQLTDAFFNDPLAFSLGYVVPVKITASNDVDSILVGRSDNPEADPRDVTQWVAPPKDFTLFAVKYINEYHGNYFMYGTSKVDSASATIENTTYSAKYVEQNPVIKLTTTGRRQVALTNFIHSEKITGEVKMLLDFNGNNCTITAQEGSPFTISGTGVFKSKEFSFGNKDRDGIELNYTVSDGTYTYTANEVLVVRDRAVVMEVYSPIIVN